MPTLTPQPLSPLSFDFNNQAAELSKLPQFALPKEKQSTLPTEELALKTIYDAIKSTNTGASNLQTLCIKALPCQLKEIVDKIIDLDRFSNTLYKIVDARKEILELHIKTLHSANIRTQFTTCLLS
jgi:hypothetical protein